MRVRVGLCSLFATAFPPSDIFVAAIIGCLAFPQSDAEIRQAAGKIRLPGLSKPFSVLP
jgi:hypothetical protein